MLLICRQHTSRPIVLALKKNVYAIANASNITLRRANYLTVQDSLLFSSQLSNLPALDSQTNSGQILLYFKKYSLQGVLE
jgi:hypothetical protein